MRYRELVSKNANVNEEQEKVRVLTNPHEMAEVLKVYEKECEEPPSKAYWRVNFKNEVKRTVEVIYGKCTFTKILQKFKYVDIQHVCLDHEEIIEECDFDIDDVLIVSVNEPTYYRNTSEKTIYVYIPDFISTLKKMHLEIMRSQKLK